MIENIIKFNQVSNEVLLAKDKTIVLSITAGSAGNTNTNSLSGSCYTFLLIFV